MRSKAPLALMEQLIMVLVFALAAALCLRAFAAADSQSRRQALRDGAAVQGQSMAEVLKSCGGDLARAAQRYGGTASEEGWVCLFDGAWRQTEDPAQALCRVEATPGAGAPGLGRAQVSGWAAGEAEALFTLSVAWQEEVDGLG